MDSHLIRFQKKKFLFLDFETFNVNLSSNFNLPWQAALIYLEVKEDEDGKLFNYEISRHDLFPKWDTDLKISDEAKRITRFSERVYNSKCQPQEEIFAKVYDLVEDTDYLVGHNVLGFDIYLLRNWYKTHGKDYSQLPFKVIDTLAVARSIHLEYPYKKGECSFLDFQMKMLNTRKKGMRTSLGALGKNNNIQHNYNTLHDGMSDLELNIKVWDNLKFKIDF